MAALIVVNLLSSCNNDPSSEEDAGAKTKETVLTGVILMAETGTERIIPWMWDPIRWEYDSNDKVNKYDGAEVSYPDNSIQLTKISDYTTMMEYDTVLIISTAGRLSQIVHSYRDVWVDNRVSYTVSIRDYHYDEQGFLVKITDPKMGKRETYRATIQNGNIAKAETFGYSVLDGALAKTITYNYTYDTKDFVPMSDWAPYTPIFLSENRFILSDKLLGKKNKNNITSVEVQYQPSESQAHINRFTYEPEYDEQNILIAVKHTGQFTAYQGSGGQAVSFDNAKTLFLYTEKK
ncbi:hypothetical protein FACS189413_00610 [Bacteroidia bacterium]|nr:hypothetical protein FACS189413_00610 [Bacteroidia bacterium]